MIINKVTFTGADNNTDINALKQIQSEFPFVEWGVLIGGTQGKKRYPTEEFILSLKDKGLNLALHLCGKWTKNILTDGNLDIKFDFFNRYQVNFNFMHTKHDLNNYKKLVENFPDKTFILQYNASNEAYINKIISEIDTKNTNILYDSSGGRGTEIKDIQAPHTNIYTGYSGGLNPDNINAICENIFNYKDNTEVWIDMESGVRTDDEFDLDKVREVLKCVNSWLTK